MLQSPEREFHVLEKCIGKQERIAPTFPIQDFNI